MGTLIVSRTRPFAARALPMALVLFGCSPAGADRPEENAIDRSMTAVPSAPDAGAASDIVDTPSFNTAPTTAACGDDANVLFLVDRSGSMNCNPPPITDSATCERSPVRSDTTAPSKWEVVSSTLSNALGGLATDARVVRAGLSYFSQDDRCGVVSAPAVPILDVTVSQTAAIRESLDRQSPAGGTPIVGALILAYKHVHEQLTAPGDRYVVLLTDGADSCSADYAALVGEGDWVEQLITVEVPKALSVGIRTFVIGAPGSEGARHVLSRIALAGGTARTGCDAGAAPEEGNCHYDMTQGDFGDALQGALDEITKVVTCEVR